MNHSPVPFDFQRRAREAMIADGFQPDFPPEVLAEVKSFVVPPANACRDLRDLLWSSIDNTESRDLDQVEWAEKMPDGSIRVLVGIADVDATVKSGSATDIHARQNATSVYTGGPVFSMLPEKLSTDLTSLGENQDRPAIIMEFVTAGDGDIICSEVCTGLIRNCARLNYDQVGYWLKGGVNSPCDTAEPHGICEQLRLQNEASQRLMDFRKRQGALTLGGVETVPVVVDNQVKRFAALEHNPARDIIESFMVAANVSMARFLRAKNSLCMRRIVRTPKRWDRIVAIAAQKSTTLPAQPDSHALSEFLAQQRQNDSEHFPELSLAILKSLGPGEYVVEHPGMEHEGHFGLAVQDYTHSTAPNRRYADLIMQRLLKAVISETAAPYSETELTALAAHCTERESAARHVERLMKKVAAASMLSSRIGEKFTGLITGVTKSGTFVRLLSVPAEGRVMRGERGVDVGAEVQVKLIGVNIHQGFIDFERIA